jgi:CBS domain containing-hemolysin-like protein
MEIAFISSNKMRFELDKKGKSLSNFILSLFYRNPNQFISTMLVGNNIALVVYGLQMAILLEPYIALFVENEAIIVFLQTVLSTLFILFMAEFIPKTIFRINPNISLRMFAIPLALTYILLYPISKFSSLISFLFLKLFGVKNLSSSSSQSFGKIDLDFFIKQSLSDAPENSNLDKDVKLFQNAMDFSNVKIRDCIVPRTEIIALDTQASIEELKSTFIETGLSKVLIYKDNVDDIIGYIHSSDLFNNPDNWLEAIRRVSIVPETMAANKLMKLMMSDKKSIAVVVDEFGGTAGIVTLEDLVEEIFGEIEDEHDMKNLVANKIAEDEYVLSGRMEVDAINEKFSLHLPDSDDYATIAGFILHHYEKFPKVSETVTIDNLSFKILKVTATKIELVRMKINLL